MKQESFLPDGDPKDDYEDVRHRSMTEGMDQFDNVTNRLMMRYVMNRMKHGRPVPDGAFTHLIDYKRRAAAKLRATITEQFEIQEKTGTADDLHELREKFAGVMVANFDRILKVYAEQNA